MAETTKTESYYDGFNDGEISVLSPQSKRKEELTVANYDDYHRGYRDGVKKGTLMFYGFALVSLILTSIIFICFLD